MSDAIDRKEVEKSVVSLRKEILKELWKISEMIFQAGDSNLLKECIDLKYVSQLMIKNLEDLSKLLGIEVRWEEFEKPEDKGELHNLIKHIEEVPIDELTQELKECEVKFVDLVPLLRKIKNGSSSSLEHTPD